MSPKKEILQTKPIKTSREISYEQNCFLLLGVMGRRKGLWMGFLKLILAFLCREEINGTKFEKKKVLICNNRYIFYKFPL